MHVVFDHQVFAFQKYGGISRYIARLAGGIMARDENTVHIIAPLHVNAYLTAFPPGIVWGRAISPTDFNRKIARNIGKKIIRPLVTMAKPDIVHETYYAANGSAPRGVPTVITVHDMIHELFAADFPAADATRALKRAAVLRADHIVCVSENTKRDLIRLIPEAEGKASVTLLGFDNFSNGGSALRSAGTRPYLLYVGERSRYKNFKGLLKAYAISPQLQRSFGIRCFGGGAPDEAELRMIEALGLPPQSLSFSTGDDSELANAYRNAAAFIYPSLYEGFGIPPLEAMSASCPVIASDRSSIPEICGDAAAYFNPDDSDSMRIAIEQTVFDNDRRADLITRGRQRLALFSWDRCVDATIDAYGRLL
jgi:glycosyltransferase involved in cell wall biosynthesis